MTAFAEASADHVTIAQNAAIKQALERAGVAFSTNELPGAKLKAYEKVYEAEHAHHLLTVESSRPCRQPGRWANPARNL